MSRTDKDRPLWVKRNDPTLLRYTDHNHLILGKVFYKKVYLRDNNGNLLTEEKTATREVFRWGAAYKAGFYDEHNLIQNDVFVEAEYEPRFKHLWREEEYTYLDYVSIRVPRVTYADHCTEGEPLESGKDTKPCTPELTIEGLRQGWVDTDARQMYHGSERRRKRDALKRYTKEANTYGWENLDDDDTPDTLRRYLLWR
jgi:hypothetical protein